MDYKEAIYHFRKFAIENGFIKEYARYSHWGLFKRHGIKDIAPEFMTIEPVKYIQNSRFFCHWPSPDLCPISWIDMSRKWGKYCLENGIYYKKEVAEAYVKEHILYKF